MVVKDSQTDGWMDGWVDERIGFDGVCVYIYRTILG